MHLSMDPSIIHVQHRFHRRVNPCLLAYLQVLSLGGPLQLPVPEQHGVLGSQSPFFGTHAVGADGIGCAEGAAEGDQVVEGCALGCGVGCGGGAPDLRWLSKKLSIVSTT